MRPRSGMWRPSASSSIAALVRFDIVPDDVEVDVRRVGPEVRVNVVLPEPSPPATEYLTSRLAGVVRAFDPYVPRIDIVVSTR